MVPISVCAPCRCSFLGKALSTHSCIVLPCRDYEISHVSDMSNTNGRSRYTLEQDLLWIRSSHGDRYEYAAIWNREPCVETDLGIRLFSLSQYVRRHEDVEMRM